MLARPSTAEPPLGVNVSSAAGHRVEAREEVARVRLAVGDVGIGGLEPEHQIGLVRALGRLERLARGEVGQRCARDLCVVGRGESVGRIGEAQMERRRRRAGDGRGGRGSVEDDRTRRETLQGPEIEAAG